MRVFFFLRPWRGPRRNNKKKKTLPNPSRKREGLKKKIHFRVLI